MVLPAGGAGGAQSGPARPLHPSGRRRDKGGCVPAGRCLRGTHAALNAREQERNEGQKGENRASLGCGMGAAAAKP